MSFFNKIIDKARHTGHIATKQDEKESCTGLRTPQSSISSSIHSSNDTAQTWTLPQVKEEPREEPREEKMTYDTPRQSVEEMKIDEELPAAAIAHDQRAQQQSALRQRYQEYDRQVLEQRKNRPRLKLDDFHLLRTLGTGSFGRVHLAQSRHNNRYYAIKVLKKSEVVRLKQVEHTNDEKRILESVANPFLVNLWGTFQDDERAYMVMDYVPGGELFSVLRKSKRFPDHVAKFYAAEVTLALAYLHTKDVVYRDLKPENLLLDAHGHIKITDFGFAKHVPDVTWTLCGTPDYLAPEVIQSKGYGKAVDWWSLGVLIFEMLAGYPPFYDEDHLRLYEKILAGKIRWPSYFDPHAKDLLKRLLTADLSRRYGNLKNGAEDIKRHPWFFGVDFDRVANRQIRAPYIPTIRGDGDASHFERYPESNEQYGLPAPDPYREKFPDF
ncbi:camp-dependent protein kinase catalytic subunit [Apophysomyces ossiformis]|uniref:cAMP-dependent protein kinase n=1 Tax=Apophysomyces ossiformis TaxID=679940 RepID=A0A8H7BUW1_9FUNG|nr:camp-dependent protein kinase catalytic subunit [Apophysomyces ossiformis]